MREKNASISTIFNECIEVFFYKKTDRGKPVGVMSWILWSSCGYIECGNIFCLTLIFFIHGQDYFLKFVMYMLLLLTALHPFGNTYCHKPKILTLFQFMILVWKIIKSFITCSLLVCKQHNFVKVWQILKYTILPRHTPNSRIQYQRTTLSL